MDGYGFHEGFFKPDYYVRAQLVPRHLEPDAARIFDQGVGRSLWFTTGAVPRFIAAVIDSFAVRRHADLWLGVGIACGYVGGVDKSIILELAELAGTHCRQLAIGAAFVAKGRLRAGNLGTDTDIASQVLCGVPASQAARLVDTAFLMVRKPDTLCAYLALQRRLNSLIATETVTRPQAGV